MMQQQHSLVIVVYRIVVALQLHYQACIIQKVALQVLGNGATHPDETVSGGETLDYSSTKAAVGFGYDVLCKLCVLNQDL